MRKPKNKLGVKEELRRLKKVKGEEGAVQQVKANMSMKVLELITQHVGDKATNLILSKVDKELLDSYGAHTLIKLAYDIVSNPMSKGEKNLKIFKLKELGSSLIENIKRHKYPDVDFIVSSTLFEIEIYLALIHGVPSNILKNREKYPMINVEFFEKDYQEIEDMINYFLSPTRAYTDKYLDKVQSISFKIGGLIRKLHPIDSPYLEDYIMDKQELLSKYTLEDLDTEIECNPDSLEVVKNELTVFNEIKYRLQYLDKFLPKLCEKHPKESANIKRVVTQIKNFVTRYILVLKIGENN